MPSHEHHTNALVVEHLDVVGHQVNALLSRLPPHVHRDDLVSAGQLALVRAARSYDDSTGVPFGRWAALRIRGALIDELRSLDWATRQARDKASRLAKTSVELAGTLGRTPSREEVGAALGMTAAQVNDAQAVLDVRVLSMDAGPDESSLADSVRDTDPLPEEQLLVDERQQYLHAAVAVLPERMRQVVVGVYFEERPMAEVAAELGITQSRVSQISTEAMALMRDGINSHLDPDLVTVPERPDGAAARRRQEYYAKVAAAAAEAALVSLPSRRRSPQVRAVVRSA
ncbi:sigma-70 family RNA polymerase sigma factor [Cellulomonas aerilata]|uniref:RNA polymerase sigma factor n=1 Tax=Cellulomonas aerilata TaxID=515326 RepID=A0A512DCS7_9CELL|nr:sigma-70 family RNA polymerase sigma factor [Cellulomonas aerilata]GEO34279.1 RNA polymerase sigma factor [Cellulomonas aerilata]